MTAWTGRAREAFDRRERLGLRRETRGPAAPHAVDLSSNDYLALARDPEVLDAAARGIARDGAGARASRLVAGTLPIHEELEEAFARFKGFDAALLFPSGYMANVGLLASVVAPKDVVLLDRLAHACLHDGAKLSGASTLIFPHNDLAALEELLVAAAGAPARWIVVDGIYSMDGDAVPLPELLALANRHDATVILDDAHGTGTIGPLGRGTIERFALHGRFPRERLLAVATLSKALGSQGGVVLGPPELRTLLVNEARTFLFTTGLAPACAHAALAALRIVEREPRRVTQLQALSRGFRRALSWHGFAAAEDESPIVPVAFGDAARTMEVADSYRAAGFHSVAIRPPTVPVGTSRLRLTVTLAHDEEVLTQAADTLARLRDGARTGDGER